MSNFHIRNWFRIGKNLSWKLSWLSLNTLLYFFRPFQTKRRFETVQKKHEFILDYLDNIYRDDLLKYKDNSSQLSPVDKKNIWVFWNTGEKNLPPIVQLCLKSVRKYANGADVHLLTMNNLEEYITIPPYIMNKYKEGKMTLAFLTDYMRISLIEKYGGLWLDATIYVSQDIPSSIFEKNLYSLHTPYEKTIFVNDNKIHCYVLGGKKGFSFFSYVKNEIEKYWQNHDFMVDYYLLDYTIMHAYKNNTEIKKLIDGLSYTSPSLYKIIENINKPVEEINIKQLEEDNIFSKLNWRITPKENVKGKKTVFTYLEENIEGTK